MNVNEARELTKFRIMEDNNNLIHNIFNNIITATENKFIETTYYFNRNISYIEVNDCANYLRLEGFTVKVIEHSGIYGLEHELHIIWK